VPDIDIDVANRNLALHALQHVPAVEMRQHQRIRHPCGVYFHDIAVDPVDHMAVWDYQTAASKGYFKVDLINNTIYRDVRDEQHLDTLLHREPRWQLFEDPTIVERLAHIHDYYDIVQIIHPQSITDVAICIALPRPGKRYLIHRPRNEIDRDIWLPTQKYYFKRAHAISYAASIIVQLNLLVEQDGY